MDARERPWPEGVDRAPCPFSRPYACSDTFDLASHQLTVHLESGLDIAVNAMRRLREADVEESHPANVEESRV